MPQAQLLPTMFTKAPSKCKSSDLQVQWVQAPLSVLPLLGLLLLPALNACQHQSKYRLTPTMMCCTVKDSSFFRLIMSLNKLGRTPCVYQHCTTTHRTSSLSQSLRWGWRSCHQLQERILGQMKNDCVQSVFYWMLTALLNLYSRWTKPVCQRAKPKACR